MWSQLRVLPTCHGSFRVPLAYSGSNCRERHEDSWVSWVVSDEPIGSWFTER
jgi:hypothetical protein